MGHQYKLLYTYSRLDLRKFFFANKIIKVWNMLPEKIVLTNIVKTFNNHLSHVNMSSLLHDNY